MSPLCTTWRMSMSNAAVVLGCYSAATVCTSVCAVCVCACVCVQLAAVQGSLLAGVKGGSLPLVLTASWRDFMFMKLLNGISETTCTLCVFRVKQWKSTPVLNSLLQTGVCSALWDHLEFFFAPSQTWHIQESIAFGEKLRMNGWIMEVLWG